MILLSGGVDSISVALAAHHLKKSINTYSFQLSDNPSYDFAKAQEVSEVMGWNFTGIDIPTDNLVSDFHELVKLGCIRKTHFECVFPFLYVYPQIQEEYVLSGWAADGYYGLSRKAQQHRKVRTSKESFDDFRDEYFLDENRAGYIWHKRVADKWDKKLVTPYLSEAVRQFFYQFDWNELNKPLEKHQVRGSFSEFDLLGKVEQHSNLQLNAGIPSLFETLLKDKDINFKGRTRMLDVYRDWVKKSSQGSLDAFIG